MKKRKVLSAIIVTMVLLVSTATTLSTQNVCGSTFGQKSQSSSSTTSVNVGKSSQFSNYLIKMKSSKSKKVYSDNYIQVTKTGGTLTFKNVSGQDITLDGNAIINNEIEVDMFSFGFIGSIKSNGSKTKLIHSLDLQDGENDKHTMKTGETLTWSGDISDSEGNVLASISFSFQY